MMKICGQMVLTRSFPNTGPGNFQKAEIRTFYNLVSIYHRLQIFTPKWIFLLTNQVGFNPYIYVF